MQNILSQFHWSIKISCYKMSQTYLICINECCLVVMVVTALCHHLSLSDEAKDSYIRMFSSVICYDVSYEDL